MILQTSLQLRKEINLKKFLADQEIIAAPSSVILYWSQCGDRAERVWWGGTYPSGGLFKEKSSPAAVEGDEISIQDICSRRSNLRRGIKPAGD